MVTSQRCVFYGDRLLLIEWTRNRVHFNRIHIGGEMASEEEIISTLAAIFGAANSDLIVGIGDDGAIAPASNKKIVMSTDMAVEGIHFKLNWSNFKEIGGKITAANLADIYAMGGKPKYLLISVALPKNITLDQIQELALGIKNEANQVGCAIVGGDISRGNELVISIAAIGEVDKPVTRGGAKVGDKVFLSNLTGLSAAGLAQIESGKKESNFITQHKKPEVPYQIAENFVGINAMADVSDGLLSECNHIATASNVEIVLDADQISKLPGFKDLEVAAIELKVDIWKWILSGGEDHAFLGCNASLPKGAFEIGKVIEGSGVKVNGASEIKDIGWRHF